MSVSPLLLLLSLRGMSNSVAIDPLLAFSTSEPWPEEVRLDSLEDVADDSGQGDEVEGVQDVEAAELPLVVDVEEVLVAAVPLPTVSDAAVVFVVVAAVDAVMPPVG